MLQTSTALNVMLIHKLSCQLFSKTVCVWVNKCNLTLPPDDESLSFVSLEGTAKQLHVPLRFLEVLLRNVCFV